MDTVKELYGGTVPTGKDKTIRRAGYKCGNGTEGLIGRYLTKDKTIRRTGYKYGNCTGGPR